MEKIKRTTLIIGAHSVNMGNLTIGVNITVSYINSLNAGMPISKTLVELFKSVINANPLNPTKTPARLSKLFFAQLQPLMFA